MSILDTVIKSIRNIAVDTAIGNMRKDALAHAMAVVVPFSLKYEDTGEIIIAMELSEKHYTFTVGTRRYHFIRGTGEYYGWSEDGSAPKPNLYALDGGKINNKENENE